LTPEQAKAHLAASLRARVAAHQARAKGLPPVLLPAPLRPVVLPATERAHRRRWTRQTGAV
jgi:hypothetical protein